MRLWTIHPKYLDTKGLLALWREALLAQKVLKGETMGYKHHPQLKRFKAQPDAVGAIATYLQGVHREAVERGYQFNQEKVSREERAIKISSTSGQIEYEWEHLRRKLKERDKKKYEEVRGIERVDAHEMFEVCEGEVEEWEVVRGRI